MELKIKNKRKVKKRGRARWDKDNVICKGKDRVKENKRARRDD